MKYVYIPVSLDTQPFYVGITGDLRARLAKHNAGEVPHTSNYGPISPSVTKRRRLHSIDT